MVLNRKIEVKLTYLISVISSLSVISITAQKMNSSVKDFFGKCDLNGKLHFFVISTFLVLDDLEHVDRLAIITYKRSHPEVFLGKGVLKTCSKFTGEHRCRIAISIKLQNSFMEITLRHGCSPVNFLHIFRTPFYKSTSRGCLWPMKYQAISGQCSISIPPENVTKPLVF